VLKQQIFFYRPLHLFFGSPADARGKTNHILISSFSADHRLSIPLFHIAYIAIGLGVQQGGQQHPCLPKRQCREGFTFPPDRFSRAGILCLLSHQGESKGAFT
jgi:hypothetical protein